MHEAILNITFTAIIAFFIYTLWKTSIKKTFLACLIILVIVAIIQSNLSELVFLYTIYLISLLSLEFLKPFGLLLFLMLKPAIGGFFEELFRSVFVVLYAKFRGRVALKKSRKNYSYIKTLDYQIYGLAFFYGIIESYRMIVQAYPGILMAFKDHNFGVDILGTSKLASIHPVYIIIVASGIILRYYIHLCLLKFSVYSLAAKQKSLYLLALLLHFSAGATLGYFKLGGIERSIVSLLVIEIVVVCVITFLLSKLQLRERIAEEAL